MVLCPDDLSEIMVPAGKLDVLLSPQDIQFYDLWFIISCGFFA